MARLSLYLLGPFSATLDGELVTGFLSNKVRALLVYLAAEMGARPPRTVARPRESLTGLLWPDQLERSARANLNNALSNLRSILGDRERVGTRAQPYLLISREAIQFNPASDCWVDVVEFSRLTEPGSPLSGSAAASSALVLRLEQALAIYRGTFLEGFSLRDSPSFEHWALVTRERLQRLALEALGRLCAHYEGQGEWGRAIELARRQLELEPWDEAAHQGLMRLLARSGRRAEALAQYKACVQTLADELGVEPSEETAMLHGRIRDETMGKEPGPVQAIAPSPRRSAYPSSERESHGSNC